MNMKSMQFAVFSLAACAASAWAFDPYIELDLDGVLGNGPDHEIAQVGDTIQIEIWPDGVGMFISTAFTLHTKNSRYLSFEQGHSFFTHQLPESLGNQRWYFLATNFTAGGTPVPFHFGTVLCEYTGPGRGRVSVVEPSLWFDSAFLTGQFTGNIDATFGPTTATESSSWSQVKELFR